MRKDLQEQWDKQDHQEDIRNKAEQLKQRVQGLRKGTVEPASVKPKRIVRAEPAQEQCADDVSESTDGCTIFLEKSVGDMSEITNYLSYG